MSRIKEGIYNARVIAAFTGESSAKKTPYVGMTFQYDQEGESKTIDWTGYLTDATAGRSLKAIVDAGFLGQSLSDLSGEFNFAEIANLSITIEMEDYVNSSGDSKQSPRVRWINVAQSYNKPDRFTVQDAKIKIASRFDGLFMQTKKTNVNPMNDNRSFSNGAAQVQGDQSSMIDINDIPF